MVRKVSVKYLSRSHSFPRAGVGMPSGRASVLFPPRWRVARGNEKKPISVHKVAGQGGTRDSVHTDNYITIVCP